jgi:hypothetical protein
MSVKRAFLDVRESAPQNKWQVFAFGKILVQPAGIEPATYGFGNRHSIQLSYGCSTGPALRLSLFKVMRAVFLPCIIQEVRRRGADRSFLKSSATPPPVEPP